jgi:hypothetical protein
MRGRQDELAAAAAKAGLPAAAGGAGRARYELVDVSAVKARALILPESLRRSDALIGAQDKRERQTHAALRGALEQQHTDHDCFLEARLSRASSRAKLTWHVHAGVCCGAEQAAEGAPGHGQG